VGLGQSRVPMLYLVFFFIKGERHVIYLLLKKTGDASLVTVDNMLLATTQFRIQLSP
jgi:hypothetical protein